MIILTTEEVCRKIGRSRSTLYRWWKKEGVFPRPILRNGKAIGWNQKAIEDFLNS